MVGVDGTGVAVGVGWGVETGVGIGVAVGVGVGAGVEATGVGVETAAALGPDGEAPSEPPHAYEARKAVTRSENLREMIRMKVLLPVRCNQEPTGYGLFAAGGERSRDPHKVVGPFD